MGGQACILYGAAEFSRDVDIAVLVEGANLDRLRAALRDLRAEPVFFPSLSEDVLLRGHACHFRCHTRGGPPVRLDVMAVLRGVDRFEKLWERRKGVRLPGVGRLWVLALPDLVKAKKTQRDRDWPMVRRLVEADIVRAGRRERAGQVVFWLGECRTPETLLWLCRRYPGRARKVALERKAVAAALAVRMDRVEKELRAEEDRERAADRSYWAPLRLELERWRVERFRRRQ